MNSVERALTMDDGGSFYNPIGSGGGGGYIPKPVVNIEPEFKKSPVNCIKITLDDGSILSILLEGFDLDGYDGDLTFTLGDLEGDVNGKFVGDDYVMNSSVFSADIIIDRDAVSENAWIELARTILHESFHAYLYTKLVTNNAHNGLVAEADFSDVWDVYYQEFGDEAGHNYMADNYITYMKEALKEFFYHSDNTAQREQFLNYVDGMSAWDGVDNFLERLCWTGLKNTEAWNDYMSDPEIKAKYNATYKDIVSVIPSAKDCNDEK